VIPIIFTIAEDSLANVPPSIISASEALGASRWQVVRTVVLPVAGRYSALMIGFGGAVGETMIVVMATGNTAIMDTNGQLLGEMGIGNRRSSRGSLEHLQRDADALGQYRGRIA